MRRALGLVALVFATACTSTFTPGAAVVNGVRIPSDGVERQLEPTGGGLGGGGAAPADRARQFLSQLIHNEIVRQEAEDRGLVVGPAEIDQQIREIKASFPSEAEFDSRLAQEGLTLDILADLLAAGRLREMLGAVIAPAPTDGDVRAEYERRRDEFREVRLRHILISIGEDRGERAALREIRSALARVRAGEPFAAVARDVSEDPASAERGGRLDTPDQPWVQVAQLDPEFGRAAWSATPFEVTEPVRSRFGYHLILLTAKRIQPLSSVQDQLRQQMTRERGDSALAELIQGAMERASIQVNPRYGDWDPATLSIVPHESYVPADPLPEERPQPGFDFGG